MNIKLTDKQVLDLVAALDDDVNYKISESGCADEYTHQIRTYIMLLKKLGETEKAIKYTELLKKIDIINP